MRERLSKKKKTKPIRLKIDQAKSTRCIVQDLIDMAYTRQKESPGTMIASAVMQHLVGAKLQIALPAVKIEHNGFSVADAPSGRKGDFLVCDSAIHVTTTPTEALIRKCRENLDKSLRPIIITTESGVGGARALAKNADIEDRIDILEIEQFVATNVYEWSGFAANKRPVSISELINTYNAVIDACETDPSLRIAVD